MKVIGTTKISNEIEEILNSAEKKLILVSPYLKLNQRLKVRLSDAFKKVDNAYLIYRENQLKSQDLIWLKSFKNLKIFSIKNLHSKIYLNQDVAVISSMNLYEYSQINNHEIGVKLEFNEDQNEYKDTLKEIRIMVESEYNDNCFSQILESIENYSMGRLFWELSENYSFKNYRSGSQYLYEFISDKAREITEFKDYELYQDKTAVLRATDLGKERFNLLKKRLKEIAN
ncbi:MULTISPECIES: phospholipase D family protein [Hwangdonia]|uniref:Phospholipase D family protein n=1 Tax=Hwangdonia seohaensis TaxID=1240727 RepID=A0ABW3R8N2_9FLAO|nr:phospholipase D family protein [Hwangdonia seohaensis]